MQACHIHTDAEGNLLEPEESDDSPHPSPISNTRIVGNVLSFEFREEGESELMKFEMTLVKAGIADLEIKNAPVKIKPIRFAAEPSTVSTKPCLQSGQCVMLSLTSTVSPSWSWIFRACWMRP